MRFRTTAVMLGAILACGPALAQQSEKPRDEAGAKKHHGPTALKEIRLLSKIIGADVQNRNGDDLGDVNDVILHHGMPMYVVIGKGGVLGVGEELVIAPWKSFTLNYPDRTMQIDLTKERVDQAPRIKSDTNLSDEPLHQRIREFYGTEVAATEAAQNVKEGAREAGRAVTGKPAKPMPDWVRTSWVIGADVHNNADKEIAEVEDLVLGNRGEIAFAILGHGGFLQIGEKDVAVPFRALRLTKNEKDASAIIVLNVSEGQLKTAPILEADNYEELMSDQFVANTSRFFMGDRTEVEAETPAPSDK
jgi:sporulation protein YlmC with PRC-barrel domain